MLLAFFLAVVAIALICRAVGDESIGFGGTLEINDGGGESFVAVPYIVELGIPDTMVGVVDSKRLDLPGGYIRKVQTLKDREEITVRIQHTTAGYARFKAIEAVTKQFRFTIPSDDTDVVVTVEGFVNGVRVDPLIADEITEMVVTIVVFGPDL